VDMPVRSLLDQHEGAAGGSGIRYPGAGVRLFPVPLPALSGAAT
jgi:hypothetical protein